MNSYRFIYGILQQFCSFFPLILFVFFTDIQWRSSLLISNVLQTNRNTDKTLFSLEIGKHLHIFLR